MNGGTPESGKGMKDPTSGNPSAIWKAPLFAIVVIAILAIVLVGGSLLTGKAGSLGRRSAGSSAGSAIKTGDPNALAVPGQKLLRITTPPSQTRTELRLTKDLGKAVFIVEFQPYGLASGGTAVVRLTKVSAQGGTPLAAQFASSLVGQNLQVAVELGSIGALTTGGTFTGKVTPVTKDGVTSFSMDSVKHAD